MEYKNNFKNPPNAYYLLLCVLEEYSARQLLFNSLKSLDSKASDYFIIVCNAILFGSGHFYHLDSKLTTASIILALMLGFYYKITKDFVGICFMHFIYGSIFFKINNGR